MHAHTPARPVGPANPAPHSYIQYGTTPRTRATHARTPPLALLHPRYLVYTVESLAAPAVIIPLALAALTTEMVGIYKEGIIVFTDYYNPDTSEAHSEARVCVWEGAFSL